MDIENMIATDNQENMNIILIYWHYISFTECLENIGDVIEFHPHNNSQNKQDFKE